MTAKVFSQSRTLNKGLLAEAKEKEERIRIQLDAIWKSILDVGAPMDMAMTYVDNLNVRRLEVYMVDLRRKKCELEEVQKEIVQLKADLGEE